ncbi:DNA-3-methyladenine glycosylase I [Sphingomonas sp. ASY06-1R]|uniref:DNA-3-methyladenine glycosylase I n=1 Tax=Sphingomonas sp. ASY06-1R TaxID=3445771 RepID=UPI003FA1DDD3
MTIRRCAWAEGDAQMIAYHDAEWGVPVRDPRLLWEMLVLEGFQAGLSWRTILHRRDGFRSAFDQFDPDRVARYDQAKIAELMDDARIIRARAKIEATIGGAKIYVAMRDAGEDLSAWLWGLAGGAPVRNSGIDVPASTPISEAISKALKARGFKFVGPTIAYAWMQAVGMVNDHAPDCFRRDQV